MNMMVNEIRKITADDPKSGSTKTNAMADITTKTGFQNPNHFSLNSVILLKQ